MFGTVRYALAALAEIGESMASSVHQEDALAAIMETVRPCTTRSFRSASARWC